MSSINFLYSRFITSPHIINIAYMHTSNNISLIQHQILNVNNSFHSQFSDNIEITLYKEFPFIIIIKNTEQERIFYNIDLNIRSPPFYETGRNIL